MSTNFSQLSSFMLMLFLIGGCTNKSADPCKLLTVQEVQKLHPDVVVGKMEELFKSSNNPIRECSWNDYKDKSLLSLSVALAAPNSRMADKLGGGSRIVEISGVGKNATAFFYKDAAGIDNVTLLAQNDKWRLNIFSPIVGDENGEQFIIVKELANKAFSSLDIDNSFSKLKK